MVYFAEQSKPEDLLRDTKGSNIQRANIAKSSPDRVCRPFDPPIFSSTKTTTEGPKVLGGASRGLGGRDEQRSQSNRGDKWIPPSAFKRDALPEHCDDVKFRKVRGILNKLTPQTFDRLSDELVGVGLDSPGLLKGVILLIFEKALQEPKYVSMYAQLCKKLSKKVPNFDPPNQDSVSTFRRLLLNKCQDEYTNRARASAFYDQRTDRLTPEEEEEKHITKRKMLGNIQFIGELGNLEMLTHSILHKCCEELVKKTKAEDLECLSQIMRSCGHLLDNDKGKYLMDQYFSRMKELSKCDKLPARIRFMLQDVIELRENSWVPRQTTSVKESPKPIQEIRREASDEMGIMDPNGAAEDFNFLQLGADPKRNGRMSGIKKNRKGMEEVFAPVPFSMTSLGTGPGVITQGGEKPMGRIESNGYHHHMNSHNNFNHNNHYRPSGGVRNYNNMQNAAHGNGPLMHHPKGPNKASGLHYEYPNQQQQFHNAQHRGNNANAANMSNGYEKAPVAPRFMKQTQMFQQQNGPVHQQNSQMNEELSLRPPPNSIMKRMPPAPYKSPVFGPPMGEPNRLMQRQTPPQAVSPNHAEAAEANTNSLEKKKGSNKDSILKGVAEIATNSTDTDQLEAAIESLKELKVPEKYCVDALICIINLSMEQSETHRNTLHSLLLDLVKKEVFSHEHLLDSLRNTLDIMGDLEAGVPRVKTYVATFAAGSIFSEILSLAEVAECTENGRYYPFLLLVLQQLGKMMPKPKLCRLFEDSKVNLMNMLPKTDRTKDRLTEILEERELSFLFPLMKIQQDMSKQLQDSTDPAELAAWIKAHVDPTYHSSQGFISALMTVIFKFVYEETIETIGNDVVNEKLVKEKEKELLQKFKPIFYEYLHDHVDLQVISVYAMQSAWFALKTPKVVLLRWFMNLYELDIIEEDAFLKWKEDIRDDYPGKGQALFQVNQWLQLLQEANESEADSDEE